MVRQRQQQSHVENIIQIDFFLRAVQTLTLHLFTRDNEIPAFMLIRLTIEEMKIYTK